mgnify:FL=1
MTLLLQVKTPRFIIISESEITKKNVYEDYFEELVIYKYKENGGQ